MIIGVWTKKGGQAKSTLSCEIFYYFTQIGKKVLLLDLDAQFDSSFTVGADVSHCFNIHDVLTGRCDLDEAVQTVSLFGDVIIGSEQMDDFDTEVARIEDRNYLLNDVLLESKGEWDVVICDLAPHAGTALKNVIAVADYILIPVTAEMLSMKSIESTVNRILELKQELDSDVQIAGLVLARHQTKANILKVGERKIRQIGKELEIPLIGTIRESSKFVEEAHAKRTTVQQYKPKSTIAQDYRNLAVNLLEVIGNGTKTKK